MSLSEIELQKARQLKDQGYNADEIKEFLGAKRVGRDSFVEQEMQNRKKVSEDLNKRWYETNAAKAVAFPAKLVPGAVGVFGDAIARSPVGNYLQTDQQREFNAAAGQTQQEVNREFIEAPTKGQLAGATLQTIGLAADAGIIVGSLGAATPATLAKNTAISGGLGYVYDVGEDLTEQERLAEVLDPDAATLIGLTAPGIFAGIGYGFRSIAGETATNIADDVGRAASAPVREATQETVEQTGEELATNSAVQGVTEQARQFAQRVPRALRNTQDAIQENAERAALRENASPAVQRAIDDGLELRTIQRTTNAPDTQKEAYRQVVLAAESADPRNAEYVAGDYATQAYRAVKTKQQQVGKELGAARNALGTEPLNFSQYKRTMLEDMQSNGIVFNPDGTVKFNKAMVAEQQNAIKSIWKELNKYNLDNITPQQVNEIDQFLSSLEYRTRVVDKIDGIYITIPEARTGEAVQQNLFRYIREVFDTRLQEADRTGDIARLKREYANLKTVTGDIEGTWFSGLDLRQTTDAELGQAASNALRRIDSRAKSGVTYQQMYNRLDVAARANGYKGANAADVSNFYLKEVEPIYKETTPPASMTGIFGGLRQTIGDILNVGGVQNTDKQRALKGLLEITDDTPTAARPGSEAFAGGVLGFEQNEDGQLEFNPENAALAMAGVGVAGSLSRSNAAKDIAKRLDDATKDELAKFVTVVKGGGVKTTKNGTLQFNSVDGMTDAQARRAFEDGLRFLDFDPAKLDDLSQRSPGAIANFYEQILTS